MDGHALDCGLRGPFVDRSYPTAAERVEKLPQTALLLTQPEWDDLAAMVAFYKEQHAGESLYMQTKIREDLANRIIEANR